MDCIKRLARHILPSLIRGECQNRRQHLTEIDDHLVEGGLGRAAAG